MSGYVYVSIVVVDVYVSGCVLEYVSGYVRVYVSDCVRAYMKGRAHFIFVSVRKFYIHKSGFACVYMCVHVGNICQVFIAEKIKSEMPNFGVFTLAFMNLKFTA